MSHAFVVYITRGLFQFYKYSHIIKKIFNDNGITRIGFIDINNCEIINQRILPQWAKSVAVFCIPYRSTKDITDDGFSEYARVYDYHNYSKQLYEIVISQLNSQTEKQKMDMAVSGLEFWPACYL